MMFPKKKDHFEDFYNKTRMNGQFDNKTSLLIFMATAMAVGCYPCMQFYLSQAEEAGVTEEEIATVEAIVMAVSGGRVMMQFRDARDQIDGPQE
ncbi:MAG: carboxymuconolactone decarboxylase family protein [Candidatus Thermoplasmatota archaeon]|nr:carboxymuconolactone decarboxylase family protein [Candidatus Thermoplasmatota archaeon]